MRKTLYILGAGASKEANLPIGDELKQDIANLLNIEYDEFNKPKSGDRIIISTFIESQRYALAPKANLNEFLYAAQRIRAAMPQALSIDHFIDAHSDDKKIEFCGKLAIIRAILKAENKSVLYFDRSNIYNTINFSSLEKTWYSSFMMLLTENCKKDELSERLKSVAFIVFNYDRCLEHFFYHSIPNYYGIQAHEVSRLLNNLEIYHPYGVVGKLPWQEGYSIDFGAEPSPEQLIKLANQIRTFTEGTAPDSSDILNIRRKISEADSIVFLGFAFHKLNMELLKLSSDINNQNDSTYFASAYGISNSDLGIIKNDIKNLKKTSAIGIHINNELKCADIFKEYRRSLSLA